jgi:hypothetical protein
MIKNQLCFGRNYKMDSPEFRQSSSIVKMIFYLRDCGNAEISVRPSGVRPQV